MKNGKHKYENVQLVHPWLRYQRHFPLFIHKQVMITKQSYLANCFQNCFQEKFLKWPIYRKHMHPKKKKWWLLAYILRAVVLTSISTTSRRMAVSPANNFIEAWESLLLEFCCLQGSMIFPALEGIHILDTRLVPTVISREMNPRSINSAHFFNF